MEIDTAGRVVSWGDSIQPDPAKRPFHRSASAEYTVEISSLVVIDYTPRPDRLVRTRTGKWRLVRGRKRTTEKERRADDAALDRYYSDTFGAGLT